MTRMQFDQERFGFPRDATARCCARGRTSNTTGSCSVVRIRKHDNDPDDSDGGWVYSHDANDVEQDPVRSMHDTQEEAGDELEVTDIYNVDALEAQQMRVALDPASGQEAQLY